MRGGRGDGEFLSFVARLLLRCLKEWGAEIGGCASILFVACLWCTQWFSQRTNSFQPLLPNARGHVTFTVTFR